MSEKDSYQKLIDRMNNWFIPLPESEYLLPILKLLYTPEEAEFLSKIPLVFHSSKVLSRKLDIPLDELTKKLDGFADRGLVYRYEIGKKIQYRLADSMLSIFRTPWWKGVNEDKKVELASLANRYYINTFASEFIVRSRSLRSVPINQTIRNDHKIIPYEDIIKLMDTYEYYSLSNCACRTRHNIDPTFEESKYPTEVCLHFNDFGKYTVQMGFAKELTKDETLDILKKAADAGLVHAIEPVIGDADTLCNCDKDYCLFFEKVKMAGRVPVGTQISDYIREWRDEEECIQCGLCAKRCPIDAIIFDKEKKEITFIPELCIGCGVCVHKCPTDAIWLEKRPGEEQFYPSNGMEAGNLMMKDTGLDLPKIMKENKL